MISEGAKTVTKVERSYPRQMQCKVLYIVLRFVLVSSFSSFGERFVITFEAHAARCRMANGKYHVSKGCIRIEMSRS